MHFKTNDRTSFVTLFILISHFSTHAVVFIIHGNKVVISGHPQQQKEKQNCSIPDWKKTIDIYITLGGST